ncbi:MAG: hypothetical protein ACRDBH_00630 [Bosea sp. (in: a-proteobacteria)]
MPDPVTGTLAAVSAGGSLLQSRSASKATRAQTQAQDASIAEQRRQFDALRELLNPYVQAGTPALRGLLDITGSNEGQPDWQAYLRDNPDVQAEYARVASQGQFSSPEEFASWHYTNYGQGEGRQVQTGGGQAAAFNAIEQSPGFQALARQGEEAILQNASATGGLRGGNTQGALARFRPALLDQFIERQFGRLGNIASIGQSAAAGVGNAGFQTGQGIANSLTQRGQAQAAGAGAQGQIFSQGLGQIGGLIAGQFRPGGPQAALLPSVNSTMNANPGLF